MNALFKRAIALYKNLKTIGGIFPSVLSAANNYVYPVIPISPLLKLRATLLTLASCIVLTGWALSFITSAVLPTDEKRIRKRVIIYWVLAVIFFGLYFEGLALMEEHPAASSSTSAALDWLQVVLFALPFAFSAVAVVMSLGLIPPKSPSQPNSTLDS